MPGRVTYCYYRNRLKSFRVYFRKNKRTDKSKGNKFSLLSRPAVKHFQLRYLLRLRGITNDALREQTFSVLSVSTGLMKCATMLKNDDVEQTAKFSVVPCMIINF